MFDLLATVIEVIQKDSYLMINNFKPYVLSLLYILCMLDLILNVSFGLLDRRENPFANLSVSVFRYAFFGYLVTHYVEVLTIVIGGGIQLGNIALGKGANPYFTTEIFKFLYSYIEFAKNLFLVVGNAATGVDILMIESLPMASMLLLGGFLAFVFWGIVNLAIQIARIFLVCAFAYPLLVFAVFSKTRDIGMKALSAIVNSAVYAFVITALLNMSNDIILRIQEHYPLPKGEFSLDSISQSFSNMLSGLICSLLLFLFIKNADAIAGMLSSGILNAIQSGGKGVLGYAQDIKSGGGLGKNPISSGKTPSPSKGSAGGSSLGKSS